MSTPTEEKDRVKDVNYITDFMGKDTFDINTSESFATWIKKLSTINKDTKYTPDNAITSFLNKDKITGVDELTKLILVTKIYEHYGAAISKEDVNSINEFNELVEKKKGAAAYKYKLDYYEKNIDNPKVLKNQDNKSKITSEISKLPITYKEADKQTQTSLNKGAKIDMTMRHNDAKEKIAFYKSKQKTKDARRDITNKAIMLHKMGRNT